MSRILLGLTFSTSAMGRPNWASDAQYIFLVEQAEIYRSIQAQKKSKKEGDEPPPKFWPTFFDKWQNRWPNPAITALVNPPQQVLTALVNPPQQAQSSESEELTTGTDSAATEAGVTKNTSVENGKQSKRGPLTVERVSSFLITR